MARIRAADFLAELNKTRSRAQRPRSFPSKQFSGAMTESKVRFLSTRFIKFGKTISHLLSHVSTRAYGVTLSSFGLVTLILYFLKLSADLSMATPIIGAVTAVISILFLLSEKPLPLFLQDFAVTDYIFFEFFCIKRSNKMEAEQKFPLLISALFGILAAVFGMVFPTWKILIVIGALAFVYITALSPEFAFFVSFLALPYTNLIPNASVVFVTLIALSVISFLRKAYFGKRVFYLDGYDIVIGIMMLLILVSGIFVKGVSSFTWSIVMVSMALGYTLANNVVINRRLADRAVNSIVISSLPPAIMAVFAFVRTVALGRGAELLDKGISYGFSSGEANAVFMIVASVFAVAMFRQSRGAKRIFYMFAVILDLTALVLTGELFAVLALLIGIVGYYLLKMGKWSSVILSFLVFLPYTVLLLPKEILNKIFSLIPSLDSADMLFSTWSESLSLFVKNLFVGIGIGADSFSEEMAEIGISGTNSSNLFIELGLEAGVFALICFVVLLAVRLCHRASYYPFVKNSEVSTLAPICSACIFSLVSYGAVNYIFSDVFTGYLFWCVFGIGSATLRVAKRETDDRVHYYEDTRAVDSSAIDVEIR